MPRSHTQEVDKVAAVVDNGVVLESDVNGLLQSVKLNAQQAGQQLPDDKTLRHQIIERLIMDNIQLQMAKKMGITVSDADLDKAIANIAAQNKMSVDQLRSRLSYEGLNYNTYRSQIRKEMLISEVRNNEVRRRVTILPQEVDSLAKQVGAQNGSDTEMNISHILIPLPENPSQQQVDKAEELAKRLVGEINSGADFGKLAITYSADSQALKGGNMGWGKLQEIPTLFAERLVSAKRRRRRPNPLRRRLPHPESERHPRCEPVGVGYRSARPSHPAETFGGADRRSGARQAAIRCGSDQERPRQFADEAKQLSQDPGSAMQGGDLAGLLRTSTIRPSAMRC